MELLGQLLVELLLLGTGHVTLWILTLGRWQGFRSRGQTPSFWDNFLATVMGFLVWVIVAIVVVLALGAAGAFTPTKEPTGSAGWQTSCEHPHRCPTVIAGGRRIRQHGNERTKAIDGGG